MKLQTKRRLAFSGLVVLAAAAAYGTYWVQTLRLARVEVEGTREVRPAEVARLARVGLGDRLADLPPAVLEDRIRRHPWVADAEATRWPTGVLRLRVRERVPVALVLRPDGTPAAYLDRDGYAMPVATASAFDVPLVRGPVLPDHPTQPVALPAVRDLLATLATLPPATDALVSDFAVDARGDVTLTTVAPPEGGDALRVRLGRDGYAEKLGRLAAFWHQAVLTRPGRRYALVDLRFAGQVVTREAGADGAFPDTTRRLVRPDSTRPDSAAAWPAARPDSTRPQPAPRTT